MICVMTLYCSNSMDINHVLYVVKLTWAFLRLELIDCKRFPAEVLPREGQHTEVGVSVF